jgi:hypothetical protein
LVPTPTYLLYTSPLLTNSFFIPSLHVDPTCQGVLSFFTPSQSPTLSTRPSPRPARARSRRSSTPSARLFRPSLPIPMAQGQGDLRSGALPAPMAAAGAGRVTGGPHGGCRTGCRRPPWPQPGVGAPPTSMARPRNGRSRPPRLRGGSPPARRSQDGSPPRLDSSPAHLHSRLNRWYASTRFRPPPPLSLSSLDSTMGAVVVGLAGG